MSHQQNLLPSLCCIMHANNLLSIITHSLVSFLHRSSSTIINRHFFFLLCHSVTVVVPNNVSAHQTKPAVSSCIRTMLLIPAHMRIQIPFIRSSSTIFNRVFFSFFFPSFVRSSSLRSFVRSFVLRSFVLRSFVLRSLV